MFASTRRGYCASAECVSVKSSLNLAHQPFMHAEPRDKSQESSLIDTWHSSLKFILAVLWGPAVVRASEKGISVVMTVRVHSTNTAPKFLH